MEKTHRATFEDHYRFKALLVFLDKEVTENTRNIVTESVETKINHTHSHELFLQRLTKDLKDKLVPKAVETSDAGP